MEGRVSGSTDLLMRDLLRYAERLPKKKKKAFDGFKSHNFRPDVKPGHGKEIQQLACSTGSPFVLLLSSSLLSSSHGTRRRTQRKHTVLWREPGHRGVAPPVVHALGNTFHQQAAPRAVTSAARM